MFFKTGDRVVYLPGPEVTPHSKEWVGKVGTIVRPWTERGYDVMFDDPSLRTRTRWCLARNLHAYTHAPEVTMRSLGAAAQQLAVAKQNADECSAALDHAKIRLQEAEDVFARAKYVLGEVVLVTAQQAINIQPEEV